MLNTNGTLHMLNVNARFLFLMDVVIPKTLFKLILTSHAARQWRSQRGGGASGAKAPLEALGVPERAPRDPREGSKGPPRGLQRAPRGLKRAPVRAPKGPLGPLSHKFVSKQLAELKWGPFRTLNTLSSLQWALLGLGWVLPGMKWALSGM